MNDGSFPRDSVVKIDSLIMGNGVMAWMNSVTYVKWLIAAAFMAVLAACASAPSSQQQSQTPTYERSMPQPAERRAPPEDVETATVRGDQGRADDMAMGEPDGVVMETPDSESEADMPMTAIEAEADAELVAEAEVEAARAAEIDAAAIAQAEAEAAAALEAAEAERIAEEEARLEAEMAARMQKKRAIESASEMEAAARLSAERQYAEQEGPVDKSTGNQATAPQWVVGKYEQKADFLADVPELAGTDKDWGQVLTDMVVEALQNRAQYSEGLTEQADKEKLRELAAEGVSYYCDGDLKHFSVDRSVQGVAKANLETVYKLRRVFGGRFLTVQREPLKESVEAPASVEAEALLDMTMRNIAVTIANRIVADIPADLAAIIN